MKKIIYNKNTEDLSLETIDYFFSVIRKIVKEKDEILIGLSSGESVRDFYENLKILSSSLELEFWKKIKFCFADERIVPLDNENSNFFNISKVFLNDLLKKNLIKKNQILTIKPDSENPSKEYSKIISKIDFLILGVGPDGHTASLFPNSNLLDDESNNYLTINDSPKPPLKRITISKKMIEMSEFTFIFFINKNKSEAYKNYNNEELNYKDCPAKLSNLSSNTYIITNLIKN